MVKVDGIGPQGLGDTIFMNSKLVVPHTSLPLP